MKQFIRLGDYYLNVADIISIDVDAESANFHPVVSVVTRELIPFSYTP